MCLCTVHLYTGRQYITKTQKHNIMSSYNLIKRIETDSSLRSFFPIKIVLQVFIAYSLILTHIINIYDVMYSLLLML